MALSSQDRKLLSRLDLPEHHKEYLAQLWADNPSPIKWTASLVVAGVMLCLMLPAMCVILIAHLLYPEELALVPFLRLVYFLVWGVAFFGIFL